MAIKSAQAADALALDRAIGSANGVNSFFAKTIGHCASAYDMLKQERAIQKTVRELQALDDATLRDIGVNRTEIEAAVRGRFQEHRRKI